MQLLRLSNSKQKPVRAHIFLNQPWATFRSGKNIIRSMMHKIIEVLCSRSLALMSNVFALLSNDSDAEQVRAKWKTSADASY